MMYFPWKHFKICLLCDTKLTKYKNYLFQIDFLTDYFCVYSKKQIRKDLKKNSEFWLVSLLAVVMTVTCRKVAVLWQEGVKINKNQKWTNKIKSVLINWRALINLYWNIQFVCRFLHHDTRSLGVVAPPTGQIVVGS